MEFCINKDQLEKALQQLNIAIDNGFKDSYAVLKVYTGGERLDHFISRYDSIILKAHPTNPSLNWGRTNNPEWHRFENGQCINV